MSNFISLVFKAEFQYIASNPVGSPMWLHVCRWVAGESCINCFFCYRINLIVLLNLFYSTARCQKPSDPKSSHAITHVHSGVCSASVRSSSLECHHPRRSQSSMVQPYKLETRKESKVTYSESGKVSAAPHTLGGGWALLRAVIFYHAA